MIKKTHKLEHHSLLESQLDNLTPSLMDYFITSVTSHIPRAPHSTEEQDQGTAREPKPSRPLHNLSGVVEMYPVLRTEHSPDSLLEGRGQHGRQQPAADLFKLCLIR